MSTTLASRPSMYQFRIDEREKAETFAILENMGIKPSQAVRLFFREIRHKKALPFLIEHIPNPKLSEQLLAPASDKDYKEFDSLEALFADLKS
jgi:DNA-damage-inducible protein J